MDNTFVRSRHRAVLLATVGAHSFNALPLTNADYLELVDFTGQMIQPGKRGATNGKEPKALTKLGLDPKHWTAKDKGIGNGYWRWSPAVDLAAQAAESVGLYLTRDNEEGNEDTCTSRSR